MDYLQKANNFITASGSLVSSGDQLFTPDRCHAMFHTIMETADRKWGGFGKAPKFPQTFTIQYLLQYHYFTGNEDALHQALLSIDKMLTGGIYDHIGGGLARYSTDHEWLAPHFEKMLYDNALLISVICDAYQLTADKKYEEAIRRTISFVKQELMSEESGFYAALDADSEGEEGKYYVWQKQEVDQLLGADSELFCSFFNITEAGNWEGKNILRILVPVDDFASEKKVDAGAFRLMIGNCLDRLARERHGRVKPSLDDKIILGWNALMLKAIAKAAVVLEDKEYLDLAEANFSFLQSRFKKDQAGFELLHTYKNGDARYPAFLDDYANLVSALIQLYKTGFDVNYLRLASEYCKFIVENFSDDESVFFFFTHKGQKDVIVRKKEIYDGATPSGNAVMADNLYQLSTIFDVPAWRSRADKMMEIISPSIVKYPG